MTVCGPHSKDGLVILNSSNRSLRGCCSNCDSYGGEILGTDSAVNVKNMLNGNNSMTNCKLSKSNILDKLHSKLNQLNKLNAQVKKCNDALENSKPKGTTNSFQSKIEFENFLRSTYDDTRYSYCILKCGPSVPHRQLKALEVKDTRIPGNMGWNWKSSHSENWHPGSLPKIIKMRMSHFLNYYPCDTLPISKLNIKLSKSSFNGDGDDRESKIKRMIQSMGFTPCICSKSVAWCTCRDKNETNKLKSLLFQIEQQIGESGLEYKLYLNDADGDGLNCKKMSLYDKRRNAIPDLINQETQYEPMDYKIPLSKPKNIRTKAAKPNNSFVTVDDSKSLDKKTKKIN